MVSAVDVEDLPRDEVGGLVGQEGAGGADIIDVNELAGGGFDLGLLEQGVKFGDA